VPPRPRRQPPPDKGLNRARGPLARPPTLTTAHSSNHPTRTKEESSALRAVKGELHRHRIDAIPTIPRACQGDPGRKQRSWQSAEFRATACDTACHAGGCSQERFGRRHRAPQARGQDESLAG
jgi:hypothetical protein